MNLKEVIDSVIIQHYKQAELNPDGEFKRGYTLALDTLMRQFDISLAIEDMDELLDQGHDAILWFRDKRLYRLDKVSDSKPFIEPVPSGYGGKKRYVEGTRLNGLFPGIVLASPNLILRW